MGACIAHSMFGSTIGWGYIKQQLSCSWPFHCREGCPDRADHMLPASLSWLTAQLVCCRCLEGLFDTWGTFGRGFINNLELGGPTPIGAKKAALTETTLRYLEEVALNEQVTRTLAGALTRQWPFAILPFASNIVYALGCWNTQA